MKNSKVYSIGQLKAFPQNRKAIINDIVQWINSLQETFYAKVIKVSENEAEFRNYYPTENYHYCFSTDLIERLIVLELSLVNKDGLKIGNVSKNVIEAFLSNNISLDESVWYETQNAEPRIHKKNLICKI